MQAAQRPLVPRLPGTSASKASRGVAIFFGAFFLVFVVPLALLDAGAIGGRGGHLPWPVVQWAFATPLGALVLLAVSLVVTCPPFVLLSAFQLRRELARAADVSGQPPWAWPSAWQLRLRRPSLQRWLGQGRGEQAVSLLLLVLGLLLVGVLLGTFVWSAHYGFPQNSAVQCDANGNACPPNFLLTDVPFAGALAGMALAYVVRSRWLRRVEATTYLLLRYQDWILMAPLCYIRPIGMTPEAAAVALARFSSSATAPFARQFFFSVLVTTPYVVTVGASFILSAWLQLQWLPG